MKSSVLLFSLLLLVTVFSCQEQKEASCCTKPATATATKSTVKTVSGTLPDMSLYQLSSEWQNQAGITQPLAQLKGKVQLVAMVYTHCRYACPRIIADLKRIESSLDEYKRDDVGIVLITMDPDRDTPEKLRQFASANRLDPSRWTLLTSSHDNIRELAALLNMKYKTELDGEISHANIISVLTTTGELVHQQEGLGLDPDETIKSIKAQLQRI
ncbi:SCO family protein [Pontibacter qinzhouensis]|uniref:SCO family protein n=1 Tax=Pontibacter qinzhouensis TaxID=2603253 RepID=A0A5C8KBF8_9BACT|nr:SCO family protein [Pontibacter qinzhouensis]TXK47541.1 SCO family protein [Pontibacter qinzhouensis]